VPGYDKIPTYLNPEQRYTLTQIPSDLSDRDIARHYTFTEKERELIKTQRRGTCKIGHRENEQKQYNMLLPYYADISSESSLCSECESVKVFT
jgi:hypothetical protein